MKFSRDIVSRYRLSASGQQHHSARCHERNILHLLHTTASELLESDSQSLDVTPLHVNPHQCHLLASKLVCTLNLMKRNDICDHDGLFHELQSIAASLIDLCKSQHRLQQQPYKLTLLSQSQEAFAVILSKLTWYVSAFLLRRDFLGILSQTLPDIWHLELREAAREDFKAHAAELKISSVVRIESKDIEVDYRTPLGQGSFGRVYKAKWLREWKCAVKEFNDATNENEAHVLASLHHPNIVQFYGTLEKSALVMELMDFDLTFPFRKELDLIVSVDIMLQAAEGMRYLHEANIVHRDLKTANILIKECAGGRYLVKLADFGLARTKAKFVEMQGSYKVGTLKWRAPELLEWICEDRLSTDPMFFFKAADVYSFGITCSEILTCKSPYTELENTSTVLPHELLREMILEGQRPLLPSFSHGVPAQLVALIKRCWDRNPDRRPSFKAICSKLKQIKASLLTEQHFALQSGCKCTSSFHDTDPVQESHQFYRTVSYSALRL